MATEINFTPSQRAAVFSRDQGLLVSAAAGSGKTFVLTQRLMAYCTDEVSPKNINSFLIITFTRAAAGEMRSRIFDELGKLSAQNPSNMHLRRQQALCFSAEIGTIHSFCQTVIRRGCHILGISPDFRVIQEDKADILLRSALERVLENAYSGEGISDKNAFLALADSVGAGRDDHRLSETVLTLYRKLLAHPYPEKWAAACGRDIASLTPDRDILTTVYGKELASDAADRTNQCIALLQAAADEAQQYGDEPLLRAWSSIFEDGSALLEQLLQAINTGWDEACLFYSKGFKFPRKKPLKGSDCEELSESLTERWDLIKDTVKDIADIFSQPSRELMAEEASTAPARLALLELALALDKEYSAAKKRENAMDFSDLEHEALKLLCDEEGNPTPFACELSRHYTEIMVDEYQDVNAVQEMIFSAVSKAGRNLFMVGDVKQSIYRFRLADPGIFIRKLTTFSDSEDAPQRRIALQENFRSRDCVIDAVNLVFSTIMSEKLGDINYDETATLKRGLSDEEGAGGSAARICLFESGDYTQEDEESSALRAEGEARFIAATIRKYIDDGVMVGSGDKARPCTYDDFAILLRSPRVIGRTYLAALDAAGIPTDAGAGADFFSRPEVGTVLDMLEVLDNPHCDVPLIALLQSPAFAFSADELAEIRLADPDSDIWGAMTALSEKEPESKAAQFTQLIHSLRALAPSISMDALLWEIYNRTDMLAICAAIPGGSESRERLLRLTTYAADFESGTDRGLYRFVKQLRRLQEAGREQEIAPAKGVHFMTVHRSKGLEFPFVFLSDITHRFNNSDVTAPVLVHPLLGIGSRCHDRTLMAEYPAVSHRAIAMRLKREMLSEEMRVLYVGMTRAKQELIMTGSCKDPDALISRSSTGEGADNLPMLLEEGACYAAWLLRSALKDRSIINIEVNPPLPCGSSERNTDYSGMGSENGTFADDCSAIMPEPLKYAHPGAVALPSKLTATELKGYADSDDSEAASIHTRKRSIFRLPDFSAAGSERKLTAAEIGTATHIFLQFADLGKLTGEEGAAAEADRLLGMGFLTPQQRRSIRLSSAVSLMASEVGKDILTAERTEREFRFSILENASLYFPEAEDEKLLLQGIIDCFYIKDGKLTILDYKTDSVSAAYAFKRAEAYRPQLDAYSRALSRMLGITPSRRILYFLSCGTFVEV